MMKDFENIKFNGRYYIHKNQLYFFNTGAGFSFKMKGKGFNILINSNTEEGYFYIIPDHDYKNKLKATADRFFNYSFNEPGIHYVDIVKANEANDNIMELGMFFVDGDLLPYDYQYQKRVKVYGDSTVAGFGILAHDGEASIHNSDGVRDFCYHALYELEMDMNILSASGYGLLFSSYTSLKTNGIINYIDKVAVDSSVDFKDNSTYDLLIISLGCNDNSFIQEEPSLKAQRVQEFKEAYKKLIDHETAKNKDLKILMVYGTLNEENAYYLYEETYAYLKPFYPHLYIHKFHGDNTGISNHAYVTAHNKMCKELQKIIKSII